MFETFECSSFMIKHCFHNIWLYTNFKSHYFEARHPSHSFSSHYSSHGRPVFRKESDALVQPGWARPQCQLYCSDWDDLQLIMTWARPRPVSLQATCAQPTQTQITQSIERLGLSTSLAPSLAILLCCDTLISFLHICNQVIVMFSYVVINFSAVINCNTNSLSVTITIIVNIFMIKVLNKWSLKSFLVIFCVLKENCVVQTRFYE